MEPFSSPSVLIPPGKAPRFRPANPQGFTLIEMLIVLAIIVIVTAVAVSGQSSFSRTLSLNNAAYDIALSIREAQSLGLSSQTYAGVINAGYGVSFQISPNTSYSFFADTYPTVATNCGAKPLPNCPPGNGIFDTNANPSELIESYSINNGFTLGTFCATGTSGTLCSTGGLSVLAISFARPNAATVVKGCQSGCTNAANFAKYTSACISIVSPQGDVRYVNVTQNSQISLGTSCL